MTMTPEAPDADVIAERFAGELESPQEGQPGPIYLFESGIAVMIDASVLMVDGSTRWKALRQAVEDLHQAPAGTVVASKAAVALRLIDHLHRRDEELQFNRQMTELGHELPEGPLDPGDPLVILRDLPPEHREAFMREYMGAARAARDPRDYQALRRTLVKWREAADVLADPAYQAEADRSLAAIENGDFSGYAPLDFDAE